jgi:glucokinase
MQKNGKSFGHVLNNYYFCHTKNQKATAMIETSMKDKVFGIELALERTTYAIVDIRGNILAMDRFVTTDYSNVNDYVSALCERMVDMMLANDVFGAIRSVGISAPSSNYMTGNIENAPGLPWKGIIPIAAMIRDRLGLAVALSNKPHARALGEMEYGAAHGLRDFALLTIGHGFGSFLYSDGMPYMGSDGFAGEIGHACIVEDGRQCACGKLGCLEAYVAEAGVLQTAREVLEESDEPSLMRGISNLKPKNITAFCEQGDQLAIEVMRRTGVWLGWGLANYASVFDPEAFVFTGGITRAGKWLLEPAEETFNNVVFHNISGKVRFVMSSLDPDVCDVLGASVLAWSVKEYSLFK